MEDDDRQKTAGSGPFGQQPESAGKDPASRLEELENQLAAAREETRQAQDRCLRERADLENLKKRSARERAETVKFANESLIRDLLPVLDGRTLSRPLPLYWEFEHAKDSQGSPWKSSLRRGPWKLLADGKRERFALFNLVDDVAETNDLAARRPDLVKELRGELNRFVFPPAR